MVTLQYNKALKLNLCRVGVINKKLQRCVHRSYFENSEDLEWIYV